MNTIKNPDLIIPSAKQMDFQECSINKLNRSGDRIRLEKINKEILSQQTYSVLLILLFYSMLMFTLPFAAFFGMHHILKTYTDLSNVSINAFSVTSAVITVYIIIAFYIYKAYTEKDNKVEKNENKTNEKKNN